MNTKLLMIASSVALGAAGLAASFAPSELLALAGAGAPEPLPVMVQLLGAMYCALAVTNWTAKANMIGGIYSRPLSLGNLLHFTMGALALAKHEYAHGLTPALGAVTAVYVAFAGLFGWLVFGRGAACKA